MLDSFMGFLSNKKAFIVPGIVISLLALLMDKKRGVVFLLAMGLIVGLNDLITYHILKQFFARPRPCLVLEVLSYVNNCTHSFSFPSNHASNIFTFATLSTLCYRNTFLIAYAFAGLVAFSRVYLGAHYPTDVLAGAVFGIIMGFLGYQLFKIILTRWTKQKSA